MEQPLNSIKDIMARRVAVVTGSNKGVGFGIVRALCKQFDGDVYLTARDEGRGTAAIEALKKEGLSPMFHQLDIDDQASLDRVKAFFQEKYNGIDVLVNNAGIGYTGPTEPPFPIVAEVTLRTNFWGTLRCCKTLFPILKPHARVVSISSFTAAKNLAKLSPQLREKFVKPVSMKDIEKLMKEFEKDAKAGNHIEKGWTWTALGISKMGVTAMTKLQQKEMANDPREDIVINSCCPGHVQTDMSFYKGDLTIDQGAENPVYLALLPPNITSPKGEFVVNKKITPWQ